jgi:hypothetical protein
MLDRPTWIEALEVEINDKLKKQFADKKLRISNLHLQYKIIMPLDKIGNNQMVLTEGPVTANFDSNFEGQEKEKVDRIVGELIGERLRSKGLW